MPQAACLTPLPLLSPLDCTVFCCKQSFTVWAAQVNLPGWLGRGDAAHSTAALAHLPRVAPSGQALFHGRARRRGAGQRVGMGRGLGEHGVRDLVSPGSRVGCSKKGFKLDLEIISFSICYNLLVCLKNSGFPQNGP